MSWAFDGSRDLVVAAEEDFRDGETGEGAKKVASFGDERADDVGETVGRDLERKKRRGTRGRSQVSREIEVSHLRDRLRESRTNLMLRERVRENLDSVRLVSSGSNSEETDVGSSRLDDLSQKNEGCPSTLVREVGEAEAKG